MNKNKIITRIENAESELKAAREALGNYTEVKPVFPSIGVVLYADGACSIAGPCEAMQILQGNTFHTNKESIEEGLRRDAETRVREAINIANEGDNGFKVDENNYYCVYIASNLYFQVYCMTDIYTLSGWMYFTTQRQRILLRLQANAGD